MIKFHTLLVLSITCAGLVSCNGQGTGKSLYTPPATSAGAQIPGDTVTALGNHIMLVFQDRNDVYWFGSWGEGLYRYDGKTMLHFTTKHGLCHDRIDEIREDASGNLYFNTPAGISRFDGQHFTTLRVSGNSNTDWKREQGDLWFRCMTDSGHVYRYDGKFLYPLKFPATPLGNEYKEKYPGRGFDPYAVYSVYTDTKGNVWFGTAVLGACRYDGKSIDWISETDVTELHEGPSNGVRSIIEDKDGKFWFNSAYRYGIYPDPDFSGPTSGDPEKIGFEYSREKGIGSLDGRKDGDLVEYLSIAKDNGNHLWIATYNDGVYRYDGENIIHYTVKNGSEDITLFSVYKDDQGNLWLGTHESGAYKFNGATFERFMP